jgi:hypothetical protein
MLDATVSQTVTHYFPWDDSDAGDDRDPIAYCGHRVTAADAHATQPTCAVCAATLDALEAAFEATPLPLDADEARTQLDPVLNAGAPTMTPMGADLFAFAVSLSRRLAQVYTVDTDQAALIGLVREAQQGGFR